MVFHMEIDDVKFTPTIQEMKRQITLTRKEFDLQIRAAKDLGNEELALTKTIEKHNAVAEKEALMQKRIQEVLNRNKVVTQENMAMVSKATNQLKNSESVEQTAIAQKEKATKQLKRLQSGVDGLSKSIKEMSDADRLVTERLKAEGKETEAQEQHLKSLDNQRTVTNKLIKQQSKLLHDLGKDSPDYSKEKMALESYKTSLAKLNKEEKQVAEQNAKLNKNLSANKESIARINSVTNAYVSRLEAEGKQYSANNAKLKGLVQEYSINKKMLSEQVAELGRLKDKYGETSKEYKNQEAEVSKLNSKMGAQEAKYKQLSKATGGYTAAMIAASDKAAAFSKRMGSIGDKFIAVGQSATLFSLGVGAAFIKGNKDASTLQDTFIKTKNIIQTSGESAKESIAGVTAMQKDAKKYSLEYGESQNTIAKGYEELVKRGYSSKQSLGAMRNELEASKASGDQFSDVLTVTSQTMEAFGMTMDKNGQPLKSTKVMTDRTKDAVNKLAYAADATSANFSDMGVAMSYVGSTAHTAGFSLSETASALGVLSNNGLEADKAGTGLRKVINSLIAPTSNGAKALSKLGLSTKDFVDQHGNMKSMSDIMKILNDHTKNLGKNEKGVLFKTLFGVTGMQAGEILANNADNLGKLNDRVKDATKNNYVHNLAKKNMDSFKNQFEKMKAALSNLSIVMQANVMPMITGLVQGATNVINAFAKMPSGVQKVITVVAALAMAFAPTVLVIGGLLKSLQTISDTIQVVRNKMSKSSHAGIDEEKAAADAENKSLERTIALKEESNRLDSRGGPTGGGTATSLAEDVENSDSVLVNGGRSARRQKQAFGKSFKPSGWLNQIQDTRGLKESGQRPSMMNTMWNATKNTIATPFNMIAHPIQSMKNGWGIAGEVAPKTTNVIGGATGKFASISKGFFSKLDSIVTKLKIPTALKGVGAVGKGVMPLAIGGAAIGALTGNSKNRGKNVGSAAGSLVGGALGSMLGPVGSIAGGVAGGAVGSKLGSMFDASKQGKKVKANAKKLSKVVKDAWTMVTNPISSKKNSKSNKAFKDIEKNFKGMGTPIKKAAKIIQSAGKSISRGVKVIMRPLRSLGGFIGRTFGKTFSKMWNSAKKTLSSIGRDFSSMGKSLSRAVNRYFGGKNGGIAKSIASTISAINSVLKPVISLIAGVFSKAFSLAMAVIRGAMDLIKNVFNRSIGGFVQIFKGFIEIFGGIFQTIGGVIKGFTTGDWSSAWKGLQKVMTGVWDTMEGAVKASWGVIKGVLDTIGDAIGSVTKTVGNLWDKATGWIGGGKKKKHALGGEIQKDHDALVGEEGPEYAYNKRTGKARILGEHGPEVTRVFAGEHILTAGQTKGLSKQHIKYLPSYANGTGDKDDKYMFKTQPIAKLKQGKNMFVNEKSKNKKGKQSQTVYLNVDKKSQRKFAKSLKDSANKVNKFEKDNKKSLTKNDKDTAKLMDKTTKKIEDSYKDMSKNLTKRMDDLKKDLKSSWNGIYKDTKSEMDSIYKYATSRESDLKRNISNASDSIYKTWKKDWSNVSKAFDNEFAKLKGYARNGINGSIDSLNGGIGNINGLIGKFGGNSSILPKISHYATGTDGKIQQDEMALVNDALGSNYKEIVVLPSGKMIMPEERNAVMPLMKGSAVINGNQVANLKNTGRLQAHADGTMSDDAMEKMVSSKIKNPSAAWQQDFTDHVPTKGTGLEQSMTDTSKNDIKTDAVPWYQALWTTIQEQMDIGSGSRGAFLKYAIEHYMGKPYKMGGDGPTYYDCSGMVSAALNHFGIDIGRTTTAMQKTTDKISMSEAKPGDLTIWGHGDGAAGHVGIIMNRQGKMFNETPPRAGYGNISDVTSVPWDGAFRIRQLHDEDPDQPKVSAALKALTKKELGSKALSWISNKFNPTPSTGATGIGKQFDNSLIGKAAKAMHVNLSAGELATIKAVIQHESGGSSSVTNNWDSNAKAGHPSKGLLQFIQSTFNAYAMKGHSNILNAYDQLLAMFNDSNWRRDVHTGGWGPTGHRRYANGGFIDHHQLAEVGELNKAEMVLPLTNKNRAYQLIDQAVRYMGDGDSYGNGNNSGTDNSELLDEIKQLRNDTNDLLKLLIQVVKDKPTGYNIRDIQSDLKNVNKFKKTNNAVMTGKV